MCGEPFFHAGATESVEAIEEGEGLVEELGTNLGDQRHVRDGMDMYIPSIPALFRNRPTHLLETFGGGKQKK